MVESRGLASSQPEGSAWEPLRVPTFRALWLASLTSNIGTWAHDVSAAWLMTSLTTSPFLVSLLQTAASLPVVLLALPAGAIADLADRRRVLIGANLGIAVTAAVLSVVALTGGLSPALLLGFTFVIGVGTAFSNPAWQATTPEVVPARLLPAAATLGGVSLNLARAVGPALGGLVVAAAGPAAVFGLNALATSVIVLVVWRWRQAPKTSNLPAERLFGAMRAGLRFARHSEELRPVLVRASAFIICGSALWALLPIIGRQRLGLDATQYGLLLGALGAGAVSGSQFMPWVRQRTNIDRLLVVASLALATLLAILSTTRSYALTLVVMFVIGLAWIALLPTFNVAGLMALPPWVRARGLSIYNVVFMGGLAMGGILWGGVATTLGVDTALLVAAGGVAAGVVLTPWFPLRDSGAADLRPALHWPTIDAFRASAESESGPAMITIEYRIDPRTRDQFLERVHALGTSRRRDGAYTWGIYEDAEEPARYVETFLVESWSEHVRQHARVTKRDQEQQALVSALHVGSDAPIVRHHVAARLPRVREHDLSSSQGQPS